MPSANVWLIFFCFILVQKFEQFCLQLVVLVVWMTFLNAAQSEGTIAIDPSIVYVLCTVAEALKLVVEAIETWVLSLLQTGKVAPSSF